MIQELKTATGSIDDTLGDSAKVNTDAKAVMAVLDTDNNGTLEKNEFVSWVKSGLSRSLVERKAVAEMSSINRRMDNFLSAVAIMADEIQKNLQSGETEENATSDAPPT